MTNVDMEEKRAWLVLTRLPGMGDRRCQMLVERFGSARAALAAERREWIPFIGERAVLEAGSQAEDWSWATRQLAALQRRGGELLTPGNPRYPVLLRQIHTPPSLLFLLGRLDTGIPRVAIVGPRRASPYGLEVAHALGEELARAGVCVVSGMAAGIDTAAHRGALAAGGRTVAVLGCGVDVVYPAANAQLHRQIQAEGAVIAEFPLGTRPEPGSFPRRNRLISGLSLGVVVVEAPERSGALITASCAMEQGREVFAVPGSVLDGRSRGCHRLLRDGAKLVEGIDDVLEELQQWGIGSSEEQAIPAAVPELVGRQRAVFERLGIEPLHVDRLLEEVDLPAAELLGVLLKLELEGLVVQLPGKQFARTKR